MEPKLPTRTRQAGSLLDRLLPPVVSARDYHRRRARAFGLFAAFLAVLVAFVATDEVGLVLGLLIAAAAGARAAYHLWQMRRAAPADQVATRIDGLPEAERPDAYRRVMWVGGAGFGALSAWTAWGLYQLETGAVERAEVFPIVAPIYEHLGFWPAVLTLPAFGALVVFEAWRKGRAARAAAGRDLTR